MPTDPRLLCHLGLPSGIAAATVAFVRVIANCELQAAGVYLYGSLARGAHRPPGSDIDLLAIICSSCPDDRVSELARAQAAARVSGARIDAVLVTPAQAAARHLPVPLDLVLPADADPQRSSGNRGMMFPLDLQDVWECGFTLSGSPVREVIPPVPKEMLRASLAWAFPHLAGNFKNPELMLCRATYAFLEDRLCSKPEAGSWALGVFDARWRGVIEKALAEREKGGTQAICLPGELDRFQRACAELIECSTGVSL